MNYIVKTKIHFLWIIYYVFNIAIKCVIYTFAFNFLQHLFQFTDIMKYIFVSFIGLFLIIRQGLYWRNFSLKFNTDILTLREGGIFVREKKYTLRI
ncbi:membrane protein YdbS with pleckstrin-like domain [Staphylococcus capitis]